MRSRLEISKILDFLYRDAIRAFSTASTFFHVGCSLRELGVPTSNQSISIKQFFSLGVPTVRDMISLRMQNVVTRGKSLRVALNFLPPEPKLNDLGFSQRFKFQSGHKVLLRVLYVLKSTWCFF